MWEEAIDCLYDSAAGECERLRLQCTADKIWEYDGNGHGQLVVRAIGGEWAKTEFAKAVAVSIINLNIEHILTLSIRWSY